MPNDSASISVDRAWLEARRLEASEAYPGVQLSLAELESHVRPKLATAGVASLERLRIDELFLACACAKRDLAAIAHFERETFHEIEVVYSRFRHSGVSLDDVKQRFRERVLLGEPPQIAGYAGIGALKGWVRAAALHMLLNIVQRETREEPTDDALFEVVIGSSPSAEGTYLKLACREAFEAALAEAVAALADRERALLRHAFVDGRNVDVIGSIYGVHRATAARWIAAARDRLVDLTRARLVAQLRISEAEAQSIIAAALSGVGSRLIARLSA